jgi:FKBP-type peptidyl-prolyl cis-trans isomerase
MKNISKTALACAAALVLSACGGDTAPETTQLAATKTSAKQSSLVRASAQADYFAAVQKIYLAYFGRPADYAGLRYFADLLQSYGAPTDIVGLQSAASTNAQIKAVLDIFSGSKESLDLYAGDNSVFIDAVYNYLFSRAPDAAGKAYWIENLNNGNMTRATAAINIMNGALGSDVTIIDRKSTVAANFTNALDLPAEQRAYSGLTANASVRNMLSQVNASTDTNAFQATVNATISQLVASAPATAEGLYRSPLLGSGNTHIDFLVVDGDIMYGMYGASLPSLFNLTSFVQGTGTSDGTNFASTNLKDFGGNPAEAASFTGTYTPGASISGTVKIGTGNIPVTATAVSSATYNYNIAANLADVAGTWRLTRKNKTNANVTVAANGSFSGNSTDGCTFTGSITPRASGKNVFDASITYANHEKCEQPGQTLTGVAYSLLHNTGATRQLIIAATNAARTQGVNYSGFTATADGQVAALQILDTTVGTGAVAAINDTLAVHYTGYIYSANLPGNKGAKFDSSIDAGKTLTVKLGAGTVIPGFEQGLTGMKQGGKRTVIIPASLAYGATGTGTNIPPNASLVFDLELVTVTKGS